MAAFESKKFSWRKGYSYKVDAETVGGVLETIEKRDGEVSTRAFLDYSRPEESETHSMFEWDDSIAAEKYRLRQAAQIINQLEVRFEQEEAAEQAVEVVPAYVNTMQKTLHSPARFVNIVSAMEDQEMRRHVIFNAVRELTSFRNKYQKLSCFAKLFKAVDETIEELKEYAG